jgi:NADH-quinone oxidoreductase subunit N
MNAIVISALLGTAMMLAGLVVKKETGIRMLALVGGVLLLGATLLDYQQTGQTQRLFFNGMLTLNGYSAWFNVLLSGCFLMYLLMFHRHVSKVGKNDAEYFALLFFITTGLFMMSMFSNLLVFFLAIEILSIPQYILAGADKNSIKSSEASLKYFLMGAFSTGILLMGITLLYGVTGSFDTNSQAFFDLFQDPSRLSSLSLLGMGLLVVALGFKVSAAPFHFWTPDVYDGTPTPFTPFMATLVKVGVFMAFIRLFHLSFGNVSDVWQMMLAVMIGLTLFIGNITAVYQSSVKRMMAYSSIAQAGFMLMAVFAFNGTSWQGILLYSVTYTLGSLGVFAVLNHLDDTSYEGFQGLGRKHPLLAVTGAISLLSLAGIPLTGGFFAKYFVLSAAVEQGGMTGLVIFAVLMAAVSAFYYFKVIISMFFKEGEPHLVYEPNTLEKVMLVVNAIILLLSGILPGLILNA